jgi:glutathionylspermidine synthase
MNPAIYESAAREKQQAIEKVCIELHKMYWELVGKEPDPEAVRAEAENLVTKLGPDFEGFRES